MCSHGAWAGGPNGRYIPIDSYLKLDRNSKMAAMLVDFYERGNVIPPYEQLYNYLLNPLADKVPDDWMVQIVDLIDPYRRSYWEFSTETNLFVARELDSGEVKLCSKEKARNHLKVAHQIETGFWVEWPKGLRDSDSTFNCGRAIQLKGDDNLGRLKADLRSLKSRPDFNLATDMKVVVNFHIEKVVQTRRLPSILGHWVVGMVDEVWVKLKMDDWVWYRLNVQNLDYLLPSAAAEAG